MSRRAPMVPAPMAREDRVRYDLMAPRPPEGEVDLDATVPGEGPLELDVGFGRGSSIFTRAEASPESRILGVEIKSKWAYKVDERRKRRGLEGVRIWAWDVRELVARAGPDACLRRVFVHFPDPWWKKRHAKRLVVQAPFLDELARLLASGGELYVQTDVEERGEEYAALIEGHPEFAMERLQHNPFGAISNRERRAEEDGLPVYRVLGTRR